jgi:hypothetical protein
MKLQGSELIGSIARSVGSLHRLRGLGDMSVSELGEVLRMVTFLLGDLAFKCVRLLRRSDLEHEQKHATPSCMFPQ